jgi:hypothetical protein
MEYRMTDGRSTLITESLALMLHIAQNHVAQRVQGCTWTIQTMDPSEVLALFKGELRPDRFFAQPVESS